ncbi:MAG: TOBE domain-containing protein [Rhodocyclaceae bacterium]|nr:TOBE domain-containing protein [Rhodocyclaceae bacterium]
MNKTSHGLRGRLEIDAGIGAVIGDTRIRLLEAISRHGSISRAAKAVPLSYKAAWDAVDAMNNLAERPLVLRAVGGAKGGGSRLTEYGKKMVAVYRTIEAEYQAALDCLMAPAADGAGDDREQLRRLLQRLSMRTSARNAFSGRIAGIREGVVDCEVCVRLDDDNEIVAVVTGDSAASMRLAVGDEIGALVKASSVLLADAGARTSARNRLAGTIARIHEGPVNSEVTLDLPGGKSVCAVVTHDSVERLELAVGQPCCAIFKASAVILCRYG